MGSQEPDEYAEHEPELEISRREFDENLPQVKRPIYQASAIPYRHHSGQLQVCLITSIKKGRWGFPKGIIDPGETCEQAALKEAEEEAGLRGRIVNGPLGSYEYGKWGTTLHVTVMLMQVTGCQQQWQEDQLRERRWVTPEEAVRMVSRSRLRCLLQEAVKRLGQTDPH